jgi:hypothetical protein
MDLTQIGGSNSAPAGALVLRDISGEPCSLTGVPDVQIVGTDGQPIAVHEEPSTPSHSVSVVLTPGGPSGPPVQAGASLTWSAWSCGASSFSLVVRFPRWTSSIPAPSSSTTTSQPACTSTDATVYVGPVAALKD